MPDRQNFTADDGCAIAYRREGKIGGKPLLLSNSLGTDMRLWDAQIPALTDRFDVIRYDARGHGQSSVPAGGYSLDRLGRDALELLDHLEVAEADFAGISLGGMIGQWLGYRAPERFRRIIIANSSAYMGPPEGWAARIQTVSANGMESMIEPVLERWFTEEFRAAQGPELDAVRQQLIATDPAGYAGCSAAIRDMDLRPTARLIEARTLVISGSKDPATPPEHSEWMLNNIRHCELVSLPAAHLSNIEAAEPFNQAMLSFLAD
ncbi:MAG: 3-oxoadipate enol-lactonase [Erythrobacter sp.]